MANRSLHLSPWLRFSLVVIGVTGEYALSPHLPFLPQVFADSITSKEDAAWWRGFRFANGPSGGIGMFPSSHVTLLPRHPPPPPAAQTGKQKKKSDFSVSFLRLRLSDLHHRCISVPECHACKAYFIDRQFSVLGPLVTQTSKNGIDGNFARLLVS